MKQLKKVSILIILATFGFSYFAVSQTTEITVNNDEGIFVYVSQMPEFPGGIPALKRYIGTHLIYPAEAREKKIEGTVYARFEVTKTGEIGKVQIQKGVHPILDKEAIRVIKTLPKFKPGMQNKKPVNVWYSIPIAFKI